MLSRMRSTADQLRNKALAALEEAAEKSKARPVERTKALSFALAYLWATSGGERWPFVNFWRDVATENDIGRSQGVNASLNAIYLALGVQRPGG